MAELRGASFDRTTLNAVNCVNAKVHSISLKEATIENILNYQADISAGGDGSQLIPVSEWLKRTIN